MHTGSIPSEHPSPFLGVVATILWLAGAGSVAAQSDIPSYLVWPPDLRHQSMPAPSVFRGVEGPARFETNGLGIRGPDFGPVRSAEYRLLFLGGSAVESFYLDQPKAWPTLVGIQLDSTLDGRRVWAGNLGRSGHNSRDHVMEMRLLVPHLPVDVIVLMMGVNDLGLRLAQGRAYVPDYLSTAPHREYQVRHAFSVRPSDPNLPFYRQGWVGRVLGLEPDSLKTKPYQVVDNAGWAFETWRGYRRRGKKITTLPDLHSALEEYAGNAEEIVDRGRAMGARVILLTQPALWRSDLTEEAEATLWMGGVGDFQAGGGRYYTSAALAQGLAAYNHVLLDVCARTGAECYDLAAVVPRDLSIFYDDCHFNEAGARTVAGLVAGFLGSSPPFRH